jgi:RNA polymerase sigma-70 factor (ECF subfamily)
MNETDEDLLKRWLMGESSAFESFYLRHSGRVLGYARKKGILKDELPELVQEVFLKLHLYIKQYEPEKKALPWFFTIVHNTCIDRLKRGGSSKQLWQQVSLETLDFELRNNTLKEHHDDFASEKEEVPSLDQALNSLNTEQLKVVNMRLHNEMSFDEISMATGKSSASLRKAYSRAIHSLRDWFEKERKQ